MKRVLERIKLKSDEFAAQPLFAYMRDTRIAVRERLAFAPCLAHFVMTFADLYALVLRDEPAKDRYQELVNVHTYEDGGHWKWFLADLEKIGYDPFLKFSDALRFVWSDATVKSRMLAYQVCRLGMHTSTIRKLTIVQCIEATGKVSLMHSAKLGDELAAEGVRKLVYFGAHHFDTESDHTLEAGDVNDALEKVELSAQEQSELCALVDEMFLYFTEFAAELLAFAKDKKRIVDSQPGG